jgi:3-hydroxybutyryl-CoA dehydrogenase
MEIKKVFIAGSGLMGSGIAQVCAGAGLNVILCDVESDALERAIKNIAWSAGKFVEKGKLQGPVGHHARTRPATFLWPLGLIYVSKLCSRSWI